MILPGLIYNNGNIHWPCRTAGFMGPTQDRPVRPPDPAATILHLLGIDPRREFLDPIQRPRLATDGGVPLREIVGV